MRAFRPGNEHPALKLISAENISKLVGVHVTTARRWKRGEEPPHAALVLIQLLTTGDLGIVDPEFDGWRLSAGKLVTPEGMHYTPGEIRAVDWWRRIAQDYQLKNRLPAQADWVEMEWRPAKEHDASA